MYFASNSISMRFKTIIPKGRGEEINSIDSGIYNCFAKIDLDTDNNEFKIMPDTLPKLYHEHCTFDDIKRWWSLNTRNNVIKQLEDYELVTVELKIVR